MTDAERIDLLHRRVDGLYTLINDGFETARQDNEALRKSVNHRLHEVEGTVIKVEADVTQLKRPWELLSVGLSGWKKTVAFATASSAFVAWAMRYGFWPF